MNEYMTYVRVLGYYAFTLEVLGSVEITKSLYFIAVTLSM